LGPTQASLSRSEVGGKENLPRLKPNTNGKLPELQPIPEEPTSAEPKTDFALHGRNKPFQSRTRVSYRDDNAWRDRNEDFQKLRQEESRRKARTNNSKGTRRYTVMPGLKTRSGELLVDQKPGTIIRRYHVKNYREGSAVPHGWHLFKNKEGMSQLRKWRYLVIVSITDDKVSERAIFTNNDTGLAGKPRHLHQNYFSLRPMNADPATFHNQVDGHEVLSVDFMKQKDMPEMLRTTMVVNWKEEFDRPIEDDDLYVIGTMSAESFKVLLAKIKKGV